MVDTSKGKALADEYGIKFLETSAKNSVNVEEAFTTLARDIKKRLIDTAEQPTEGGSNGIRLKDNKSVTAKKKKCCSG